MWKKVFAGSAFALLLVSVAQADRATLDDTITQVAMPLSQPPTIDGVISANEWVEAGGAQSGTESFWRIIYSDTAEDFVRGGSNPVTNTGGPLGPEDIDIRIWVGYDSDNLYVAVRVVDDFLESDSAAAGSANGSTWEDDSVEVFIDGDNSNFPTHDTTGSNPEVVDTGGQFVITVNNAYREAEAGNPGYGPSAAWYALTEWTANGYEAEFRISMDAIGNPQPGDIIGFTIAVNDDDDGGGLENQYIWVGQTHVESTYGNLILGPRRYTAPKVTSAPTIDGTINPSEYSGAPEIIVTPHTGVYETSSTDNNWEVGDHGFSAWIVHDDEAVYVAIDAIDDIVITDTAEAGSEDQSTWLDDAVEVFFDADHSKTIGRDTTVQYEGQFVITPNGAYRDNEANNPLFGEDFDWFAAASTTSTGYQAEFKILKETILNPADGAVMGFNIALNDDDAGGDIRKSQINWNGFPHQEMTYGELILSAGGTPVNTWSLY